MQKATQQLQQGQARAALNLMQMAIEKDKSRWDGYEFAGQIAGTLKDYDLAISMFRKALMLAPADNRQAVQYKLDDVKQKMAGR
jgi:Tfp pilus assembly protein PilF